MSRLGTPAPAPGGAPPPGGPDAPSEAPADAPILAAVARGAGLIVGGSYAARLIGLVSTFVVARLLTDEDYGVFAIGLVFYQLMVGFTEIGLNLAVVRFRDATREDYDTLFTLSFLRGVLLAAVMAGAGPVMAAIYDDPRLLGVFLGLALTPLLLGLVNPRFYEFEREGDFTREVAVTLTAKVTTVTVTIALAVLTGSYVAIVAGVVADAALRAALSYALRPALPRFSLAAFSRVFGFTGWITLVAIFAALNNKLDAMLFGRLTGTASAGQLYIGAQLAELPTRDVSVPLARAIYPSLSARQTDPEAVRRGFLSGCQALGAVALPASVGLALVAPLVVPLLVGAQWDRAVPVVQIVGPVLGLQTIFGATQGYAMSVGRVGVVAAREAAFFCLRTPVLIAALLTAGFTGGLYAVAAMGLVHCVLNGLVYARLSGRAPWEPLLAARRSVLATAAMAAAVLGAGAALPPLPDLLALPVLVALGGLAYLAAHWLLWRGEGRPAGVEASVAGLVGGVAARLRPA